MSNLNDIAKEAVNSMCSEVLMNPHMFYPDETVYYDLPVCEQAEFEEALVSNLLNIKDIYSYTDKSGEHVEVYYG